MELEKLNLVELTKLEINNIDGGGHIQDFINGVAAGFAFVTFGMLLL